MSKLCLEGRVEFQRFMLQDAHGIDLELGLARSADNFLDVRSFHPFIEQREIGGRLLVEQGYDAPLPKDPQGPDETPIQRIETDFDSFGGPGAGGDRQVERQVGRLEIFRQLNV